MDAEQRLDDHLAHALDELLSLASLASASGRPELALAANAALDQLLVYLVAGGDAGGHERARDDVHGDPPHAHH